MKHTKLFKQALAAVTAILLALFLVPAAFAASLSFPFDTVALDQVNMRKSPSSDAMILERVPHGDTVSVMGESGKYFQVYYKNKTGYILKEYLSTDKSVMVTPAPTVEPTAEGYPYETETTGQVNLRSRKSTNSAIKTRIPKGTTVTVTDVSGTWAAVEYKGKSGFVKTDYLIIKKIVKPTKTPKPTQVPTPVPTLSAQENASYYDVLQFGNSGSAVRALQEALTELSFYHTAVTSVFDTPTQEAVIAFQKKNKYPETGIVDANLQAFLYSGKPLNKSGVKTKVKTLAPVAGVTVTSGAKGELVEQIQLRLHELGYYSGSITGTYDQNTRKAVTNFQKMNALTADAICGIETQNALFSGSAYPASYTPAPTATVAPTPAPTFLLPSGTVRSNSKGSDAKLVQQRLKDLGYLTGKVDGDFGDKSVEALKAFQTKHGLTADGVAGTATVAILFSYNALSAKQTATPAPTPTPVPLPTPEPLPVEPAATPYTLTEENAVKITLGTTGDEVLRLQTALSALGYYESALDGVCRAADVEAIRLFQKANGLNVDGIAGYDTQSRLYSVNAVSYFTAVDQDLIAISQTAAAASADTSGTSDKTDSTALRKGSVGQAVSDLQNRLIALGYLYGKADGVYGTATARAVAAFQAANQLSRDGVAGERTLNKLYSSSAVKPTATPKPTVKPTATPKPTEPSNVLKQGDSSSAVKAMQQRLIDLGYLTGKADGVFGLKTYQALVTFQRNNALTSDGIAGSQTLSLLDSASARSASGATPTPAATPQPTIAPAPAAGTKASAVIYDNWYTTIKGLCKQYPYATVYDFKTGISWQVHMFSLGAHADVEPLTAMDTAKMLRVFGEETWEPKAVWVTLSSGKTYMASTHSHPHGVSHITDNNFAGHTCIHFPRTSAQVTAIGPYATRHQTTIDAGWTATQAMK